MNSNQRARTKIVATVGPACAGKDQLGELVAAGVSVFRLNMAHGEPEEHADVVQRLRELEDESGRVIGILVDLPGPKIRLGELPDDLVQCELGQEFRFVRGDTSDVPTHLVTTYERLVDELSVGDTIILADGTVAMDVIEKSDDALHCQVVQEGKLRSRQGVNLPGAKLSLPALTEVDRQHVAWATQQPIDFVSLSFVRQAQEILELKSLLGAAGSEARVIAKIEKPEALENLDEILEASDGIMIARGDLGVEVDFARMARIQKEIILAAARHHRPVITATQMLDSMQHSRRPTRAEATDVANAILDGTDACMLSGETAIGDFPRQTVDVMNRIALETEQMFRNRPLQRSDPKALMLHPVTEAIVHAAGSVASQLEASLVIVASHSGATAVALSRQRNYVRTIGVSESHDTLRQMTLLWGVQPLAKAPTADGGELLRFAEARGRAQGGIRSGDYIVLIAGTDALAQSKHNMIQVYQLP